MPATSKKYVLVTGGSNGIGHAIAKEFSGQGMQVVIADVLPPATAAKNTRHIHCDVSEKEDVEMLFRELHAKQMLPELLVLNAGKGIHELLAEGDPEKWQDVINTNIAGTLRPLRAFIPHMLSNKKGHIIFISSVSAQKPYKYGGVYGATKAAVAVIAETLRLETPSFIKTTVVEAGVVDTNFFNNRADKDDLFKDTGSLSAEDVAKAVAFAVNGNAAVNKITIRPEEQEF